MSAIVSNFNFHIDPVHYYLSFESPIYGCSHSLNLLHGNRPGESDIVLSMRAATTQIGEDRSIEAIYPGVSVFGVFLLEKGIQGNYHLEGIPETIAIGSVNVLGPACLDAVSASD